jgi:hypothetical protein
MGDLDSQPSAQSGIHKIPGLKIETWSKLDRPLRQVKLRGLERVDWFYRMTIVAQNLTRMRRLIPIETGALLGLKCV